MTDPIDTTAASPLQLTIHPLPEKNSAAPKSFWSGETPSFKDVLDTINPLQHIPVVAGLYQSMTGDVPSTGSSLAGGALFGGPLGFVASLFNNIIQNETGASITGNIMAAIEGKPIPALQNNTQTADNTNSNSVNASIRTNYNAYVQTQNLTA